MIRRSRSRGPRSYNSRRHSESYNNDNFREKDERQSRFSKTNRYGNTRRPNPHNEYNSRRRRLSTSPVSDDKSQDLRPNHNISYELNRLETEEVSPVSNNDNRLDRLEKMVEMLVSKNQAHTVVPDLPQGAPDTSNGNIPELVPRNSMFTTSMWLNVIEELSVKENLNERQTIELVINKMTGVIKAWYNSISRYNFSWPELKLLIVKTFPDNENFASTLSKLVFRKKESDESWTNYFFSKLYMTEACKITGADAVSCIIDGFNNEAMQADATQNNYLTPESLYSMFMVYLPENGNSLEEQQESYVEPYVVSPGREERKSDEFERNNHRYYNTGYKKKFYEYKAKTLPYGDCRRKIEEKKRTNRWGNNIHQ